MNIVARLQLLVCTLVFGLTGCNYLPWPDSYGAATPPASTRGINGLGVHKRMWETAGARMVRPVKLSPRLSNVDVIVLIGTTYKPPGKLARDWIEDWLTDEQPRKVIYFGRDFDASLVYQKAVRSQVSEPLQSKAEENIAALQAENFQNKVTDIAEDTFCRWFYLRTTKRPQTHRQFSGPWADAIARAEGSWETRMLLEPPSMDQSSDKPSWLGSGNKAALKPAFKMFWASDDDQAFGEKEVQRSSWRVDELKDDAMWDEEFTKISDVEVLLKGENQTPLVYSLRHADFYQDNEIVIVANGAPFLNGSLIEPLHQRVGELVINRCLPAKRVALVEIGESGILISHIQSESDGTLASQLLTLWPLSAVTMHAALLGLVAFMVLLPILGRPQKLPSRSVTDFGLHIEALGRMLASTRDLKYGREIIKNYFSKIRRESPPEWLDQVEQGP